MGEGEGEARGIVPGDGAQGDLDIRIDEELDLGRAVKLPMSELAALGAGFGSYASQIQTIAAQNAALAAAQQTAAETVTEQVAEAVKQAAQNTITAFIATDDLGNDVSSKLFNAADGLGKRGSYHNEAGGLAQARFQQVTLGGQTVTVSNTQTIVSSTVVPDPTMMLVALALMEVNEKLDRIQGTLDDLMRYNEHRDMAKMRGDLKALTGDLKDYAYNSESEMARQNAHKSAMEVRNNAEARIIQLRAELSVLKGRIGRARTGSDMAKRAAKMSEGLDEYRLALHAYDYAYFAVVVLQGNYEASYLEAVRGELRERDLAYRQMYTECYDAASQAHLSTVDGAVLRGLATAAGAAARAIAATPVGDHTLIDETLEGAGDALGQQNERQYNQVMDHLRQVKDTGVSGYIESLDRLDAMNNSSLLMLADTENVYLLPQDAKGATEGTPSA